MAPETSRAQGQGNWGGRDTRSSPTHYALLSSIEFPLILPSLCRVWGKLVSGSPHQSSEQRQGQNKQTWQARHGPTRGWVEGGIRSWAGTQVGVRPGQGQPNSVWFRFVVLLHIPITGLGWLNLLHRAHVESMRDPNQADLCRSH